MCSVIVQLRSVLYKYTVYVKWRPRVCDLRVVTFYLIYHPTGRLAKYVILTNYMVSGIKAYGHCCSPFVAMITRPSHASKRCNDNVIVTSKRGRNVILS